MTNLFKELTTFEGNGWTDYLERLGILDVFKELIEKYKERPNLLNSLIRYIVWAYSQSSDRVLLGTDWQKNKKQIYDAAELPPVKEVIDEVVYLKNDIILNTIKKWLEYQDIDAWTELCMLKDLRIEMQVSANGKIFKSTGEIDYDQKFKNAKYSMDLYNLIKDTENKLLQNDPKMKDAVNEVRKASRSKVNIGPETFAK